MNLCHRYRALTPGAIPHQQTIQGLHQHHLFRRRLLQIGLAPTVPLLGGSEPAQVLVWAGVVVEQRELMQCHLQRSPCGDDLLAQQRFQGAKQALDPAVAPRRAHGGALVLDVDERVQASDQARAMVQFRSCTSKLCCSCANACGHPTNSTSSCSVHSVSAFA